MIVLDTNVISEAMLRRGDPVVLDWYDEQIAETLYLTSITVAELRYGIAVMAHGRRKEALSEGLEHRILPLFGDRVLDFDLNAAAAYGAIRALARSRGKAIATADGYIAAIAAAHEFAIASRDTSPFEAAGLPVINPWKAGS